MTAPATIWFLAEGATGNYFDLFVLLANPTGGTANVRATYLLPSGATIVKTYGVAANSRFNVSVGAEFPTATGKRFGALIESLGSSPAQLVVERAIYSNAGGVVWAAGSNALATRLQ